MSNYTVNGSWTSTEKYQIYSEMVQPHFLKRSNTNAVIKNLTELPIGIGQTPLNPLEKLDADIDAVCRLAR